jgi:hypothetical protein
MPNRASVSREVLVSLCVGVVASVAISWLAMFLPHGDHGYGPPVDRDLGVAHGTPYNQGGSGKTWQISEGRNAWHHVVSYWWMQVSGQSLSMPIDDFEARKLDLGTLPDHLRPDSLDNLVMLSWYRETGWPMKALTCSTHWKKQISNADIIYTVQGGLQLPRDKDFTPRALPITPVWPGFAVNVVAWGGAWWLAMAAAGAGRRAIRRRSNRCVACGYPRQGLPADSACPECGEPPNRVASETG